jgi:hypothetical protein
LVDIISAAVVRGNDCSKNRAFVQGRDLGKKWRNGSHILGTTNSISTAAEYGRMMNKATFQSKWKDPC